MDEYKIGDHIVSIHPFGAFVDIVNPVWQGIVLIPDISWELICHPSDVLGLGQEIEAEILILVPERIQVRLGIKQCQENIWLTTFQRHYQISQTVEVHVTQIHGVYVTVESKSAPTLKGYILVSELTHQTVESGQILTVYIKDIRVSQQLILFSLNPD